MVFRPYSPLDRQACLEILAGNTPEFFASTDGKELVAFLDSLPGPYFVLEERGETVACGGWALDSEEVAALTWGMVRRDSQRRGLGRELLHRRLAAVRDDGRVKLVRIRTVQLVQGFYEREGFVVISAVRNGFGEGLDLVTMELPLELEPSRHHPVTIRLEPPGQADVRGLLDALDAYLGQLYPAESNHLLDVEALRGPGIRFLVARADGEALGCGALRIDHAGYGEVKRMYVAPTARGRRVGRSILTRIEEEARAAGLPLVRLETGVHQVEALGLYRSARYRERGPFGAYHADPLSIFMEKQLQ